MLPEDGDFTELLAKKEQEWKELQHCQVQFLEKALKDTKKDLQEQKEKFDRLKKDFTHNLKVLGERDRDLEQYEIMFSHLKVVENGKQSEISDLKINIEKLQQQIQNERKKFDELQNLYQRKLKEHQIDLERVHSSKNSDINHHREEYEKVKRQLERKIEEVQGDLSLQKQELMHEFDVEMKRREHEFCLQLDEISTLVLSHELKAKLLAKELAVLRELELKTSESLKEMESLNQKLQEALKQKDWELMDVSAVKDARIKLLEDKVQSLEFQCKKQEEAFQRKHEQLDRYSREKESALKSMKEAHKEEVQLLEKQIKELQMCSDTMQMEQRRAQCHQQEVLAEKEAMIEKLKEDVDTLKTGWDSYIAQISKESVNKDLQLQSLQEEEEKLKAQLARYQKDIERYQQQLAVSVEREHILEQSKVQIELDWQKRCEQVEKAQYQQSEELIESLTKAKEQTVAELKEKERKLNEMELVVSAISWERDRAMEELKKHGAALDRGEKVYAIEAVQEFHNNFPSNEIRKLQEQNCDLRNVIGQMRKEMESLSEQISAPATDPKEPFINGKQVAVVTPEYVQSLEDDIRHLKQQNRIIEEQLQSALSQKENHDVPSPIPPVLPENAYIQNYIRSLNETIGALRADKVTSAAATKRLEARAAHLDSMVTELTHKVQLKQADVDQLQFQLNNETRHSQAAISCLQQRQAELEMQLTEARKEAEEYFKGNLQQNIASVGLGNEVSALKLELASQRAPVVLSQNATVKQLQEEILTLREQLSRFKASGGSSPEAQLYVLRNKLKEAAKKISQLSLEKQQLIDLGNRLRAELASNEASQPQMSIQSVSPTVSSNVQVSEAPNRLSALEGLQYELTCQELQYAQYQRSPGPSALDSTKFSTKKIKDNKTISAVQLSPADDRKPQQKDNTSPRPSHKNNAHSPHSATSWVENSSLQDVWKILDMGSSPSLISSQEDNQKGMSARNRLIQKEKNHEGSSTKTQTTLLTPQKEKSNKPVTAKQSRPKTSQKTPKIRNYNWRE
ncbi:coiled-coil domain-containing protein 57 [Rhinophrynus dorsalis]